MNKKNILAGIMIVATVVYVAFVLWSYTSYLNYVAEQEAIWVQRGRPLELFEHDVFFLSEYGRNVMAVTGVIFLAAVVVGVWLSTRLKTVRAKTTVAVMVLLLLSLFQFGVPAAKAELMPEAIINALVFFDEETLNGGTNWNGEPLWAEGLRIQLQLYTKTRLDSDWNIEFNTLNLWEGHYEAWSSPDTSDAYDLIQEGMHQKGGVWETEPNTWRWIPQPMIFGDKSYIVDLLIFMTGQTMVPASGYTAAYWNSIILSHLGSDSDVIIHELGHQFLCEHCGGWCVMSENFCTLAHDFCSECSEIVTRNRMKWGEKIFGIKIYSVGGVTVPASNINYQVLLNTSFKIIAFPSPGYSFNRWIILTAEGRYESTFNPLTFIIDNNHLDIYAYFVHVIPFPPTGTTPFGSGGSNVELRRR